MDISDGYMMLSLADLLNWMCMIIYRMAQCEKTKAVSLIGFVAYSSGDSFKVCRNDAGSLCLCSVPSCFLQSNEHIQYNGLLFTVCTGFVLQYGGGIRAQIKGAWFASFCTLHNT